MPGPDYGMNVFVFDEPATIRRDLSKVNGLNFGWVKSLFRWDEIEHDYKGAFDWTESDPVVRETKRAELKLIARLDFQPWWARPDNVRNGPPADADDFADFVYVFIQRYGKGSSIGRVHAIQIWNEPNTTREWGGRPITRDSAVQYVHLMRRAYRAVKSVDPTIPVITGALALTGVSNDSCCQPDDEYLTWMYASGLKGSYDAVGVNANVQCPCVDAAPGSMAGFTHDSFYFRRVEQLREIMVANGGEDKQIWLTEFGWTSNPTDPSYSWYAISEEQKGQLLVEAYRYARRYWAPWIGVMSVWTMADPDWSLADENVWDDEQYWWSITNPDGSNRPAYQRLRDARASGELPEAGKR